MDLSRTSKPIERRRGIDNGRAWFVLVASYTGLLIHCMTLYMNGVIYIALLRRFEENVTKTSLVPTLSNVITCFGGPIVSIVINKFSCRFAIVTGGVFTTAGYAFSAFVPNINWAILTAGVFVGIGQACTVNGCICAIALNFDKYRDLFITLCYITNGIGLFIATPLALLVLDNLGLSNFFLVCASFSAHVCLLGTVVQPSVIEKEIQSKRNRAMIDNKDRSHCVGCALLSHKALVCYLCTNIAWGFSFITCANHVPNYVTTYGGSDQEIELVMIGFSVGNILGRGAGFLLTNCCKKNSLYGYVTSFGVCAMLTMTFPLYAKMTFGVYAFVVQTGFFTGIPNAMMSQLPARFVGISKLSEANGLSYFFLGLGFGIGTFINGVLYDLTRSYEYSFVLAGTIMFLGAILGYASLRLEGQYTPSVETVITLEVKEEATIALCDTQT